MLEAHRFDKRSTIGGSVILISSLKISLLSLTHKFSLSILKGFSLHFTLSFLASTTTTTTTFSILFFRRISLARNVRQSLISLYFISFSLYRFAIFLSESNPFSFNYYLSFYSLHLFLYLNYHYHISFCLSIIITISLSISSSFCISLSVLISPPLYSVHASLSFCVTIPFPSLHLSTFCRLQSQKN